MEDLEARDFFYHLEPYTHRYPHCWRCGTPLLFRVVDEWYISMGPVYDKPRDQLTAPEKEASLRYQIMDVVDQIRWIPGFGYERELDWLRSMADWMISKKRYWGLALPIWECTECGSFEVISGRDELQRRAITGWQELQGHTPHRPYVDAVKVACSSCGAQASRVPDVGNPWLDAGIVPFSTLHYRTEPEYWQKWFPADFVTESFPGQFRNWFYSMLAMSTVLRREPPFKTLLGYATLFGEDGRPMHKSWGNAIEFNEGAERIGVDVMRWMFARQRPEDNILFGYHTADEARRELLVLWNVYYFLVSRARLAGWHPTTSAASAPLEGQPALDRWISSRRAGTADEVAQRLADFDATGAARSLSVFIDDLSTWYLRRTRKRFATDGGPDADSAFRTLHSTLTTTARMMAPILPFLSEAIYDNLVDRSIDDRVPPTVHMSGFPKLGPFRDEKLEASMAVARRAVDLVRTLRSQAGLRTRQPLARIWLALPTRLTDEQELLDIVRDEVNVKELVLIGDESDLVERRVKPLLPKIGKRLGPRTQQVLNAARNNEVEYLPGGGARLAGVELTADEIEILSSPRPGTAVAHDNGLVVVIDTELTPKLLAEGDARELSRAVQDLRKQAELELDDRIDLWLSAPEEVLAEVEPYFGRLAEDTLALSISRGAPPDDSHTATQAVSHGAVAIGLRRHGSPT